MKYIAEGQMSLFDQDTWFGRTYQEHSVPTVVRTSAPSSKKLRGWSPKMPLFLDLRSGRTQDASWEMDGASLGVPMTLNFGESPNVAVESRLSQILEDTPHPKYYLSKVACQGILNRAERKGKKLPDVLRKALIQQISGDGGRPGEQLINRSYCIGNGQAHDAHAPEVEVAKTLNCMDDPMKIVTYGIMPMVAEERAVVRRLTPMECEHLQGFPDGWTDIGDWVDSRGKKHKGDADSPRYKALGNSIALPFWQWMAARMATHLPENATMASLFDGIGGFPLVFSRSGVTPVWASEIEEFPIAVTKIRFKEDGDEQE